MKSLVSLLCVFLFRAWLAALRFPLGGLLPADAFADGLRLVVPEAREELCVPELVRQADWGPWEPSGRDLWADRASVFRFTRNRFCELRFRAPG